ncbi:MAG: hypothetical protein HQL08_08835 [Nitrospirae bacterium]|nr:hypothetical protein [Nitrospirota bacterium]
MNVIDVHTHGAAGLDTRSSDPYQVLSIADIHGSLGVSAILPAIYPAAIKVMRQNMAAVKEAMEIQQKSGSHGGDRHSSRIEGVHLEGPFLNPSRCGALKAEDFLGPAEYHLQELIEGFEDIVRIVTIAPELEGAERLIRKIADMGIVPSMGHSEATYNEAERGFNAGARGITHIFNAMRSFHHREPGIAGFGLLNPAVYVEVIADPWHLHQATIDLIFKVKDPAKIIIVSDSVRESKMSDRTKGVTDSGGTLMGGSLGVTDAVSRLVERGLDRDIAMNCITVNPARYLATYLS